MSVKPFDESLLLGERWFAGKHRAIARVLDAGEVAGLQLAEVRYADGGAERYLLPAGDLHWGALVGALRRGPLTGSAGRLELRAEAPLGELLGPAPEVRDQRVPSTDQSNTLSVVGERLLVKAYRNLRAGHHPEIEVGTALLGRGAPVPAHAGSLELVAPDGRTTTVALLQEYVADAATGWEAPIEAVAAHLCGDAAAPIDPYISAGRAVARLHRALAAALGVRADAAAGARWHAGARAALASASALDGRAATRAAEVEQRLAPLAAVGGARVQRIHGDLHIAQLLFAPDRVLVIDFEGDPTAPLNERRAADTTLRDLAALLRSIDHVGSAAARRAGGRDPGAWIAAARDAALTAHDQDAGTPTDPALLHAFEVAAELRELVYAHRVLPEWAYVAHAGLERLLAQPRPQEPA
jgi:predicted trehalose synthase